MILIKKIEIQEVEDDYIEVYENKCKDFSFNTSNGKPTKKQMEIYREVIYGTRFINERGQPVCIGTSLENQNVIGLCFKTFHNQINKIHEQSQQIRGQQKVIERLENNNVNLLRCNNNIKNMRFFQRLKFLFKGEINDK